MQGITPHWEAVAKHGLNVASLPHRPGLLGASEFYSTIGPFFFPWGPEEYLAAIASRKDIIATTKPDVVGVDPLFFAAQDACKLADQKFMVISPSGIKELSLNVNRTWRRFGNIPCPSSNLFLTPSVQLPMAVPSSLASGLPFLLKWWQIPINIYLHI